MSSFEAPIKLVVQVVRRDGSNESGPPSEGNRSARWNSKLSASKLYFYAPPSPIDSKTLTRSNFRVPSTIHLGQLLVRSSLFPSSFQRLNFPWLSTRTRETEPGRLLEIIRASFASQLPPSYPVNRRTDGACTILTS